ncbi:MAG: DUF3284 domain-containing protein [Culicoidibacterales bacterium]
MAKLDTTQTYKYPIDDVFTTISDSILKQMKGKGRKNNINLTNPQGKISDYQIKQGNKQIPIHFEVIAYQKPNLFKYEMTVDRTRTVISWELEEFDTETTNVVYSEATPEKSFIYSIFAFINKNKFRRTSDGYFYSIDSVLEKNKKQ